MFPIDLLGILDKNLRMNMSPAQALLELTIESAEAESATFEETLVAGLNRGLPPEVMTRLEEVWTQTRIVAGHVVCIGKIIVRRIMEFLQANPHLAVGLALGAVVGFLVSASIPWIGAMLAPLATAVGAVYGMGIAAARSQGDESIAPFNVAVALAKEFFSLLVAILNAVTQYIEVESAGHGVAKQ